MAIAVTAVTEAAAAVTAVTAAAVEVATAAAEGKAYKPALF